MTEYTLTDKQRQECDLAGYVNITRGGKQIRVTPSMVKLKNDKTKKNKVKYKLLGSSGSKKSLEALINKYYFSTNWKILSDNSLFNPMFSAEKNRDINVKNRVIQKAGRWRYEEVRNGVDI